MGHVIYLTGVPATGKTKLCEALWARIPSIRLFKYSEQLAAQIGKKGGSKLTTTDLRLHSSYRVHPDDVAATDRALEEFVAKDRSQNHVLIDSHAVTKESYGYRATPFSPDLLSRLSPSAIFCLIADAQVIQERIRTAAGGRPSVSTFHSDFHVFLQASLAMDYGFHLGVPVYFLDSVAPTDKLAEEVLNRLSIIA